MAYQPGPARLGHGLAVFLLLILTIAVAGVAPPALAAPAPASLSDVFSALRITPEPADYIVIVDTSSSMTDQNRYQRVQAGLSRMAQALSADDRVAVITFDADPTLRRPLTKVGSNRGAVVSALPATPNGQATDIGKAIGSALDLMQGSNLRSRAAVLLFTDGKLDTDKDSPYKTVTSPGWASLKQRAGSLQSSHDIAPLAIALTSNTDAAVLKQVFSNVSDVSATDLGSYLSQVSTEVMKAAAVSQLKGHLADPVTASLEGISATGAPGKTPGKLVLHNTNPLVPVEVSGLSVTTQPTSWMSVTGIQSSVTIAPGATATIPVTASMTSVPVGSSTSFLVTGTVSSPWQKVITDQLQLTWSAKLTSKAQQVVQPSATASRSSPAAVPASTSTAKKSGSSSLLLIAGGLVLLVIVVIALRALRGAGGPQLTGTVSVLRLGRPIDERLLRGRAMSFRLTDPPVAISLRGTKTRDGNPGVAVTASGGKDRATGTLFEGDTLEFAGLVVTYTTDRTRMLRLIGTD